MNPLTLVKRLQNITAKEADLGISEEASWHAKYKGSAYIFVGGLPFDLTEGDLLAVFAQYGEIVDVNLVRDKVTGKSKGFAFIAYEDQRSTILAVDNLNGTQILGRTIRVDHVEKYKKKEEEDEEMEKQKREARGVCRAFQRGECTRGDGCKFSHDEQRAANTGWGHEDKSSRWGHDKFEGSKNNERRSSMQEQAVEEGFRSSYKDSSSRRKENEKVLEKRDVRSTKYNDKDIEPKSREDFDRREEKRSRYRDDEIQPKSREDHYRREEKGYRRDDDNGFEQRSREDRHRKEEKRSKRDGDDELKPRSREDHDRRDEKRSSRRESESYQKEDLDKRGNKWPVNKDSLSLRHGERDDRRRKSDKYNDH
ncbi:hypothetical protein SLEP1_g6950 [Rubroshorea leprosula]|uniref:Uncharacterized protein n=1 Tax=Rubroshorea leprosula TaxID=152421 RepID=A0AAV5I4X7_9ROSI|nr:hypothetical protein SLEP1_g6950 [Rubroshorea leprosula]